MESRDLLSFSIQDLKAPVGLLVTAFSACPFVKIASLFQILVCFVKLTIYVNRLS